MTLREEIAMTYKELSPNNLWCLIGLTHRWHKHLPLSPSTTGIC
jgi:hypothetical protein